jgi:hypothetical protein
MEIRATLPKWDNCQHRGCNGIYDGRAAEGCCSSRYGHFIGAAKHIFLILHQLKSSRTPIRPEEVSPVQVTCIKIEKFVSNPPSSDRRLGLFYFATMLPEVTLQPLDSLASRAQLPTTGIFDEFGGEIPTAGGASFPMDTLFSQL